MADIIPYNEEQPRTAVVSLSEAGVRLSETKDAESLPTTQNEKEMLKGYQADKDAMDSLSKKIKGSFNANDVDAMFKSLASTEKKSPQDIERDKETLKNLKKLYEDAFDNDGTPIKGKEQEAKDFNVAVQAQMLASQLTAVEGDPAKIKVIMDQLNSLSAGNNAVAQQVIAAAVGQASSMFMAAQSAIETVAAIASGAMALITGAAGAVGRFFSGDEVAKNAEKFFKSINEAQLQNFGVGNDNAAKAEMLRRDFNQLQLLNSNGSETKLQMLNTDAGSKMSEQERLDAFRAERPAIERSLTNLVAFKNHMIEFESKGDASKKPIDINALLPKVRSKMDEIEFIQMQIVQDIKDNKLVTAEQIKEARKPLIKAQTDLKALIQANLVMNPVSMQSASVSSALPTSGLAYSTETTTPTDPSKTSGAYLS